MEFWQPVKRLEVVRPDRPYMLGG